MTPNSQRLLRGTLYFTFAYNLMGFVTFLMPESFGGLAGLPMDVPFLYSGFLAFNILIFAFVGLWQARRPEIDAPVLVIFAVCKIMFCCVMLASWLLGEISMAGFLMSLVDLAMAFIFLGGASSATARN